MARSTHCPGCRAEIAIPGGRVGRFRIRCPRCSTSLALTVPEDETEAPTASLLDPHPSRPPPAADPAATTAREIPREGLGMSPPRVPQDDARVEEIRIPSPPAAPTFQPPRALGGYRVGRPLGLARVGPVFEAWSRASGRALALAVVRPRWAAEATFLARFAREAFALEHLEHPNLAPMLDVDVGRGFAFAVSDSAGGLPLSDPRAREGLDRSARVAAVLHAARGLLRAHEQGIYHRDLSPGWIQVDEAGLVRLGGVGLGLTPETPEAGPTPVPPAGSTPTPGWEPSRGGPVAEDLAGLGRALQSLVGGDRGERAVPPILAGLIRRMVGDRGEPGFADLGAAVRALEDELGVGGAFLPRDEESREFEACAREFQSVPLARARSWVSAAGMAALGLFAILAARAGRPLPAVGALAFGALVGASTVALRGILGRDPLFERVRALALGGSRGDALTMAGALSLLVATLAASGLLGFWVFLTLLAAGLAAARHYALDRPIEQARAGAVGRALALTREFRRQGVFEDSIRRFACRHGGRHWEECYEALFGYPALRSARSLWGADAGGGRRARFAAWRDPIIGALDARLEARREARALDLFRLVEERNLEARGVNLLTARRKSRRVAEAIVTYGRSFRKADLASLGIPLMDAMNRVALRPDDYLTAVEAEEPAGPSFWRAALGSIASAAFGPRARFLLGGVLLAASLLWMHQNALFSAEEIRQAGLDATATADGEKAFADAKEIGRKLAEGVRGVVDASTGTRPLELSGLPPGIARRLDGFGLGVAGLILVASAALGGVRIAAFALPAALLAALGPQWVEPGARTLGVTSLLTIAVALGLLGVGVAFGRPRG